MVSCIRKQEAAVQHHGGVDSDIYHLVSDKSRLVCLGRVVILNAIYISVSVPFLVCFCITLFVAVLL